MNRGTRRSAQGQSGRGASSSKSSGATSTLGHGWKTPSNRLRLLTVAVSLPLLVVSGVLLVRGQPVGPPPALREETLFAKAGGKERA